MHRYGALKAKIIKIFYQKLVDIYRNKEFSQFLRLKSTEQQLTAIVASLGDGNIKTGLKHQKIRKTTENTSKITF